MPCDCSRGGSRDLREQLGHLSGAAGRLGERLVHYAHQAGALLAREGEHVDGTAFKKLFAHLLDVGRFHAVHGLGHIRPAGYGVGGFPGLRLNCCRWVDL